MSVEEYLELDRNSVDARYEYIDGVVTMLAGGTTNHSRISVNVVSLLRAALRGSPCEVFNSDLRVSISSTRYVLPDASVATLVYAACSSLREHKGLYLLLASYL